MPTYEIIDVIDGQPTFDVHPKDWEGCKKGGACKVLSPVEFITDQQRKWYRGVCLRGLAEWSGDTAEEWDLTIKALCGGGLLKTETIFLGNNRFAERPTIRGTGKNNMTKFIENILSKAIENDWPVTPPQEELRTK